MESGYGSAIPTCILAAMSKTGAAQQSKVLNVGDYIISVNGVTFVGVPLKSCLWHIRVSVDCAIPMSVAH